MISNNNVPLIDVEKVIANKNKKVLRFIPKFVIKFVQSLIHQDDLNRILSNYGHTNGLDFVSSVIKDLNISYNVLGEDNIDISKRYIIVSNHPLGGLDGIVLMDLFGKKFKNIKFVVNDLLYNIEPLKPLFIPINKYGRQSQEAAIMVDKDSSSNPQILYFPAGLCSRLVNNQIEDLPWKHSYINQAIKYKRDILPVYFEGKNSPLFYRVANLRKRLKLKFNFETILLPKEMFKKQNSCFNVIIGEPISYQSIVDHGKIKDLNNHIRERVYKLYETNGTSNSACR